MESYWKWGWCAYALNISPCRWLKKEKCSFNSFSKDLQLNMWNILKILCGSKSLSRSVLQDNSCLAERIHQHLKTSGIRPVGELLSIPATDLNASRDKRGIHWNRDGQSAEEENLITQSSHTCLSSLEAVPMNLRKIKRHSISI